MGQKSGNQENDFTQGQHIDCRDTVNQWINAEIISIREDAVQVHYSGWSETFEQWISKDSDRLLKQWERGKEIKVNNRIDVRNMVLGWLQARVVEIQFRSEETDKLFDEKNVSLLIHYLDYHQKNDEWIELTSDRIAEISRYSKAYGGWNYKQQQLIDKSSLSPQKQKDGGQNDSLETKNPTLNHSRLQLLQELLKLQEIQFREKMFTQKKQVIIEVGGDGNCLFRSISHQIYGRQDHHADIRKICMDYIQIEKAFFINYITSDFQAYIEHKRGDGIWGDDVEIQAMSEIYNRPIEIYAYKTVPMQSFHEDKQRKVDPICLSYHGRSHYNSIKDLGHEKVGLEPEQIQFGELEEKSLEQASERVVQLANIIQNEQEIKSENGMEEVQQGSVNQMLNTQLLIVGNTIAESRKQFELHGMRDIEIALEESLKEFIKTEQKEDSQSNLDIEFIPDDADINDIIQNSKKQYDQNLEEEMDQILIMSSKAIETLIFNFGVDQYTALLARKAIGYQDADMMYNWLLEQGLA